MILVSDLHMGKGDASDDFSPAAETAYLRLLKTFWSSQHVVVGDGLELWQASLDEVILAHPLVFEAWGALPREVILIPGNHDASVGQSDRRVFHIGGVKILLLHGHQFDAANKTGSGLGKIVTQLVGFLERRVHKDIDDWLLWFKNKIDRRIGQYDKAMAALAKEEGSSIVAYGHTHLPSIQNVDGVGVINCGCWTRRFESGYPYIKIDGNGVVTLKWWI